VTASIVPPELTALTASIIPPELVALLTASIIPPDLAALPALLDVRAVAAMLNCSPRHVYRLADACRMPAPVRIGALVRWRRTDIESWLKARCPATHS
jgi:excisionase family DNA binding protein